MNRKKEGLYQKKKKKNSKKKLKSIYKKLKKFEKISNFKNYILNYLLLDFMVYYYIAYI